MSRATPAAAGSSSSSPSSGASSSKAAAAGGGPLQGPKRHTPERVYELRPPDWRPPMSADADLGASFFAASFAAPSAAEH
jgi:hypothetical protein